MWRLPLLGVKWWNLIMKLENTDKLHPDQHGSQPGHQATNLTLLEELTYDISRCSRTAVGNFDNNAKACYNQVIAEISLLAAISQGQYPNMVLINTWALQEAQYYIQGNLNETKDDMYQHSSAHPIYGTGQGCAKSPTVWCLLSLVLFKAHNKLARGSYFCQPDWQRLTKFSMVGFIDDSTGKLNFFMMRPQPSI